jgi:hypothetical protein
MTSWDELLGLADPSASVTRHDELLVASSAADPRAVADHIVERFGTDDSLGELRLVVDGVDRGVLHRPDAYGLTASVGRGGPGAGDHGTLPGYSTQYVLLRLRCRTAGCAVHATVLSFDEDDAPRCPVHGDPMRLDG